MDSKSRAAPAPAPEVTADEARRRYKREWARRHRDSVRESQRRYWQGVADRLNAAAAAAAAAGATGDSAQAVKEGAQE